MNANSFTNIDEYIAQFDSKQQKLLQHVREIIREAAPEAKETISYQMPTFRLQGNLIHFALSKKHLGIYPGPAAIRFYQAELSPYKTSKGAIQLPLDHMPPKTLLQKIVQFNLEKQKDKVAPDWKRYHHQWAEAVEKIQRLIGEFPLQKTFKWGGDVYTFQGKNVLSFGGFKHHFAIWFYNGVFLEDLDKVLVSGSEGKTKGLRQWRFNHADEMDPSKIKRYIAEAIQTIRDGKEIKADKGKPMVLTAFLAALLDTDNHFNRAFFKLTPGRQREYNAFIEEAKQDKTKQARLEKIKPLVAAGMGLHAKYKS
ncbi:DUF1801 domain-containing protein [Sphingobacterium paludis]|uniref:Uncharacterized protein YdeI (YjbR/CyaY-like superfamily) n=1 Tax=Sphingobacterium paludis TaxID=1476465 RepID=A0A4R7CXV8_9SPHI|nr:DUF1801 domain-containing protein [Sphingobacterium paludis]TDS11925.1 uncharacterized protein YdeI (YjbR/CyaY-like superfamily) [Sphingobacterium paludis]